MFYNTKMTRTIGLILIFCAVFPVDAANAMEKMLNQEQPLTPPTKMAAGVLPFFDDGRTVLLGKEYRERYKSFAWMEFGGNKEQNETLAQTAHREANEETAQTLERFITLAHVEEAEANGHYVDHLNPATGVFYRMYCLKIQAEKPSIEAFHDNVKKLSNNTDVNKSDWQYFETDVIMDIHNHNGNLPGTDAPLYSTMKTRLEKLGTREFFKDFCGEK